MKILLLDTSSKFLSLAVAEDDKVLSRMHRLLDRKHSTRLISFMDKILKRAGVPLERIDGFCVNKGPGSFTGLRIGITTIKGLAYALRKPVVAIPSLDILAQNVKLPSPLWGKGKGEGVSFQVCPIVDAKQNKVYACLYQLRNGKIKRKSGYLLLPIEELLKKIKGGVFFLGDGVGLYREKISQNKNIRPVFAEEKIWYPMASRAVSLALERFREGKLDDVHSLVPLYLYPRECQIRLRKIKGRETI